MRYFLRSSSLVIRGSFRAFSSGHDGGVRNCTTLLNHQVESGFSHNPDRAIEKIFMSLGFSKKDSLCLLTAVSMDNLCILSYDPVMVFITAGITHPDPVFPDLVLEKPGAGTINIIVVTRDFADQGLVDTIITVTEAKALALFKLGHSFAGTVTDAVIIATENCGTVTYAGSATDTGRKIHEAVFYGVQQALQKSWETDGKTRPSFFIWSSMGGNHWVLWDKNDCPYYPCHFPGQRCEFCYCPLYPCGDNSLGEWIKKPGRSQVWACTRCTLNHDPEVTRHLLRNPEASLKELKAVYSKKSQ
ncbi:MAG: hypothetical protein GXY48_06130 [Methanomicrobiales archaeon]|nr:hypothetical protein [Methanomicrobiales archaeon]